MDRKLDHKRQFISQFHPLLQASFFIAARVLLYTTAAGKAKHEFTRPLRYNGKWAFDQLTDATHATPNRFNWRARTHASDGLALVQALPIDVDCGSDPQAKREYLKSLSAKCREIGVMPSHIVETAHGYHITFSLQYPFYVPAWRKAETDEQKRNREAAKEKLKIAEVCQRRLCAYLGGDPNQPGLNMLSAIPSDPLKLIHSDPSLKISCGAVLKALKFDLDELRGSTMDERETTLTTAYPLIGEGWETFPEGIRNWSIYTLGRLCKQYGRDISWAIELMETLSPDTPDREIVETVKSAYRSTYHVSNTTVRRYLLGACVSDAARRYGIYEGQAWEPYQRKTETDEELYKARTANEYNQEQKERTTEMIRIAVADLIEEGRAVTQSALNKRTGLHPKTLQKYKGWLW